MTSSFKRETRPADLAVLPSLKQTCLASIVLTDRADGEKTILDLTAYETMVIMDGLKRVLERAEAKTQGD